MSQIIRLCQLIILLASCGHTSTQVNMIEKYSDLKLPKDYQVLQDKSNSNGIESKYSHVTVELEFDSLNFSELLKSVPKNSKYWREDGGNLYYSKKTNNANIVTIIIDPASRLLLFTFDNI